MFALKGFSDSDFELLRRFLVRVEMPKGGVLIKQGETANRLFFIEDGSVKLVQRPSVDGGDDVMIGAVKAGGFFGEEALLRENQHYLHTAVALENTVAMTLNQEGLQALMVESIGVGTKLLLALSKTYREALATPETMGKVLTFYSPKGGAGTTTLAVNLAVMLARTRKRVLLVDADLHFGNANLLVGAPQNPNLARLVQMETRLVTERIRHFISRRFEVDFLFSPEFPQEAELISRTNLNQILRALGPAYDYVVLDTGSVIDDHTLLTWDLADVITLVGTPDLAGVTRFFRLFKVLGRLNFPKEKLAILVNRYDDSRKSFVDEYAKLPAAMVATVVDDVEAVTRAAFDGSPMVESSPQGKATGDLRRFLTLLVGEEATANLNRGGIFSRLRSLFS